MAQSIERQPANREVARSIPREGHMPGVLPHPPLGVGCARVNRSVYLWHIDVSLPLFFPPFPPL